MNDFDIDLNGEIGTSVSTIKNKDQLKVNTDTDIDYDKLIDNIQNSETIKQVANNIKQKEVNIDQFIKNVETDLDKMGNFNYLKDLPINEPLPANLSKDMIKHSNNQNQTDNSNEKTKINKDVDNDILNFLNKYLKYDGLSLGEYGYIAIYLLLFMILNNKFIIELIYNIIPVLKKYNNPYPNLIIRTIIFGILLYFVKTKFNL